MTRPPRLVAEHGPELSLPPGQTVRPRYDAHRRATRPELVPVFVAPPELPDVEDDAEWTG